MSDAYRAQILASGALPTSRSTIGDKAYADGYGQAINNDCSCPYDEGTEEHERWWDGFGDGIETLHD